jgi:hypothetical protein
MKIQIENQIPGRCLDDVNFIIKEVMKLDSIAKAGSAVRMINLFTMWAHYDGNHITIHKLKGREVGERIILITE